MPCYCSKCFPFNDRIQTKRTIKGHLKDDQNILSTIYDHTQIAHFEGCILRNTLFLATGEVQTVNLSDAGMYNSPIFIFIYHNFGDLGANLVILSR